MNIKYHITSNRSLDKRRTVTTTESLATKAMISAQDTTPGHSASTMALTLSMKSNPRTERLGGEVLSVELEGLVEVTLSRIEASQP